jgi:AcrR family transcriptional regulator
LPQTPPDSTPGLRERKKAQTRAAIQRHALELFAQQGYAATTVDQIIRAVDVSESTFFRYFPTKESLVLTDDFDPIILASFVAQPAELGVMDALRNAFASMFESLTDEQRAEQRDRMTLILGVPGLRAAVFDQLSSTMDLLSDAIAVRAQLDSNNFAVRIIAGAVAGASMAVLAAIAADPDADYGVLLDRAMSSLQDGLAL